MDIASPPIATRLGSSRGSVLDAGASGVQQLMLLEPGAPYVFSEFLGLQPSETENGVFGRLNNDYRTREGMYTFFFFFCSTLSWGVGGGGTSKASKGSKVGVRVGRTGAFRPLQSFKLKTLLWFPPWGGSFGGCNEIALSLDMVIKVTVSFADVPWSLHLRTSAFFGIVPKL